MSAASPCARPQPEWPDDDIADVGCKEQQDIVFDETKNPNDKTKEYKNGITMYFKRTFVSPTANGAKGAWNSLVLPVTLTKAQFHKAFGDDAKLAKADKLYETTTGGVSYTKQNARSTDFDISSTLQNEWKLSDMDMIGSYDPHTLLPVDSYIFNNGDLYHVTQTHWMKGFRCWLEPTRYEEPSSQAKEFSLGVNDGATTRIVGVTNAASAKPAKVYNLNGQEVGTLTGVQPGVYIIDGKKEVIRK